MVEKTIQRGGEGMEKDKTNMSKKEQKQTATDKEQPVSKRELAYLRNSADNSVIAAFSNKIDGVVDEIQKQKCHFDKTEKAFLIAANRKRK